MRFINSLRTLAVAGVAAFALTAAQADAGLVLDINAGATIVNDNGPGDSDPDPGEIINTTNVAGFGVAITLGKSNSPGAPSGGLLQVTSLLIQNNNAFPATLLLDLSDTDFSLPGSAGDLMNIYNGAGVTYTFSQVNDTLSFQSFADPANTQPLPLLGPSSPAVVLTMTDPDGNDTYSGNTSGQFVRGGGAYSLGNKLSVTLSAGGQVNFSGTTLVTVVPEPASAAALLLAGGALVARRRKA